jgi:opacity protein-like surface antigen
MVERTEERFDIKPKWRTLRRFDTLTARVSYLVQPNLLLYGQGGAAWTQWDVTFNNGLGSQVGEVSGTKTGWTAGGGVEWMFIPHWIAYLEYNYIGFGTFRPFTHKQA